MRMMEIIEPLAVKETAEHLLITLMSRFSFPTPGYEYNAVLFCVCFQKVQNPLQILCPLLT